MSKQIEVSFTARYTATVIIEDGQSQSDAIADIEIPENRQCTYMEDSFEVEMIDGKAVSDTVTDGIAKLTVQDGGVYADEDLMGEYLDGRFIPNLDLMNRSPSFQRQVEQFAQSHMSFKASEQVRTALGVAFAARPPKAMPP